MERELKGEKKILNFSWKGEGASSKERETKRFKERFRQV